MRFSGRVQGVGFRATARAIAARHGVSGWVRNEPDGTVSAEVQGKASDIESFLADLRGAMGAHIRAEHGHRATVLEGETAFSIRT